MRWFGIDFPFGTIIVNLIGAFLVGLIQQIATESLLIPENGRLLVC